LRRDVGLDRLGLNTSPIDCLVKRGANDCNSESSSARSITAVGRQAPGAPRDTGHSSRRVDTV